MSSSPDTGNIIWEGIFIILCIELCLVALLCCPLPQFLRKLVLKTLASSVVESIATGLKWVFGIILCFFLDACRRYMSLSDQRKERGINDNIAVLKVSTLPTYMISLLSSNIRTVSPEPCAWECKAILLTPVVTSDIRTGHGRQNVPLAA